MYLFNPNHALKHEFSLSKIFMSEFQKSKKKFMYNFDESPSPP